MIDADEEDDEIQIVTKGIHYKDVLLNVDKGVLAPKAVCGLANLFFFYCC